jgi:hypothetical protein
MNSGYGSAAIAYGCRVWVNFNGSGTNGTNQTIRGSGNVFSVFKNAVGDYTVNFITSMPDANYCFAGSSVDLSGGFFVEQNGILSPAAVRIAVVRASPISLADSTYVTLAVFR